MILIDIYWQPYTEFGAKWVCRWFDSAKWWGIGDTKWEAFKNSFKPKNPRYPHGL